MRTDENPRSPDPETTMNPLCRASVPLSDLADFLKKNALTDSNIADIISRINERSIGTNESIDAVSNVVPVGIPSLSLTG